MIIKNGLIVMTLFLLPYNKAFGQESANLERDKEIINKIFHNVPMKENDSSGDIMVRLALSFLDTPYVGSTLEVGEDERLVINARELDCTTFMETCVALTCAIRLNSASFESYCAQLERIRYRKGVLNGYVSRLHYTTDWISDNVAKGIVEDVSGTIGGKPFQVKLSYMSSHSENYKHLNGRPERTARIKQIEDLVSRRGSYRFLPKEEISSLQEGIFNGDIIGFTTSIEGMDISHIGIAYWQNNVLTFIHASSTAKKVIINTESLSDYCAGIRSNTGIVVARVK